MISGCATTNGRPLDSLCILDFESQMCWIDKGRGEGYSFISMMQDCEEGRFCWFGITENDLDRIHKGLNSASKLESIKPIFYPNTGKDAYSMHPGCNADSVVRLEMP